jgi:hypothetical protein
VCRHWRYAVDERTRERDVRTKILDVMQDTFVGWSGI